MNFGVEFNFFFGLTGSDMIVGLIQRVANADKVNRRLTRDCEQPMVSGGDVKNL